MRIGVLFFGLPRRSDICVPSIESSILDPLAKAFGSENIVVISHLYHQEFVANPRSGELGSLDPTNYEWFGRHTMKVGEPQEALPAGLLEKILSAGDPYRDDGKTLRNLLLQLISIQKTIQILAQQPFDVAVFARADLQYHDPLPTSAITFAARNERACIVPYWQWWQGCNDRFAICGRVAALSYGNRINAVEQFCNSGSRSLNAESLVEFVVRIDRLKLRTIATRASRIRINGHRHPEAFDHFSGLAGGARRRLSLGWTCALSALM